MGSCRGSSGLHSMIPRREGHAAQSILTAVGEGVQMPHCPARAGHKKDTNILRAHSRGMIV